MGYEADTPASGKWLGLFLAILFHVVLAYGLSTGLGRKVVKKVRTTVTVAILKEAKLPPPPPPEEKAAKPRTLRPKAFVPKAETVVKPAAQTADQAAITSVSESAADVTPLVEAAPPPPPPPEVKTPRLIAGCPPPVYPQRSIDKGEEGLTVFRFMIGLDGGVKKSILVQSSGSERLDEAARQAFERCKFVPGTIDGDPAEAWVRQPFRWQIQ